MFGTNGDTRSKSPNSAMSIHTVHRSEFLHVDTCFYCMVALLSTANISLHNIHSLTCALFEFVFQRSHSHDYIVTNSSMSSACSLLQDVDGDDDVFAMHLLGFPGEL